MTSKQFDLICQAIDKADTATMEGGYMLDSDDCINVVRVMQALFDVTKPAQEVGLTDEERADMACAVAAICTGTSSRTVAATAIEWTERALRAKGGK